MSNTRAGKNLEHRFREFLAYEGNKDNIEVAVAVELYLANPEQDRKDVYKRALDILAYQSEVVAIIEPLPTRLKWATVTFAVPDGGTISMRLQDTKDGCVLRSTRGMKAERKACGKAFEEAARSPVFLRMIASRRGGWEPKPARMTG